MFKLRNMWMRSVTVLLNKYIVLMYISKIYENNQTQIFV